MLSPFIIAFYIGIILLFNEFKSVNRSGRSGIFGKK